LRHPARPLRCGTHSRARHVGAAIIILAVVHGPGARAATAQTPSPLSLEQARSLAREASPDLRAAQLAVSAAAAREHQAGALPNPTLSYGHERTSRAGQTNAQHIATLDQPLEIGGQRGARVAAARARHGAAEARLAAAEAEVDFEVARAYARAVAADRRAALAGQAAAAFAKALDVSRIRLASGDVSGYADRRLRLEAARYAGVRAEAELARRSARLALAVLVAGSPDSIGSGGLMSVVLSDSLPDVGAPPGGDSLNLVALTARPELRVAALEAAAAEAEARVASRERVPVPVLSAGVKAERVADPTQGSVPGFNGFVAGVALPLLVFDRRQGAVQAAHADARRREAEAEALRRRVVHEVVEALDALRSADEQLSALAPQLGPQAEVALRAAQVAYGEGEISLVEWLDAARAYQEAESSFATLRAERAIRWAALERAVGRPISRTSPSRPTSGDRSSGF